MVTNHRRLLLTGAAAALAIVSASAADAAIKFHTAPTVSLNGLSICTDANVSGLGNENIFVSIDATFRATTTCRNPGGNIAPGQPLVSSTQTFTSPAIEPKNGRAQIHFCSPAPNPSLFPKPNSRDVCPNGNWTVDDIEAGDISVLTYFVTVTQGQTTLYTCSYLTGTCSY